MYTRLYTLAMITTLMPHLRIGPYKEGVTIDQIQMPFHAVGRSFPYELLVIMYVRSELSSVDKFLLKMLYMCMNNHMHRALLCDRKEKERQKEKNLNK